MSVRFICLISFGLALSATLGAEQTAPAGGGRLLPHPDILALPAQSPAAPAQGADSTAAPAAAATVKAPDPQAASSENQELPPRKSKTGGSRNGKPDSLDRPGLIRDLWPLLAVLVLIAAIALFLKKFLPTRRLMAGSQVLRIVARTHVTPKQQLMLIKLGRRMVLLGVSPDRISTLSTVDDPEQVALLLGEVASSQANSASRAFVESMGEEADTYEELPEEDATSATRGQVHGLLEKVRSLAGKTG